jgi:hypothetical protein
MNWFYVENGQQAGPVTDEELSQLFQSSRITADTLIWREGLADWIPYQQAMNPAAAPPPVLSSAAPGLKLARNPDEGQCAECGKSFPKDELVTLNRSQVCAQCKPVFLQRMAEGVSSGGAASLWREGKKLVTRSETPFPDRCVKCNAPANGFRLKRVLYWQHPAYYLLILCNLLIMVIVMLIVRKKAVLHIGLCEKHRKQRQVASITATAAIVVGLTSMIGGLIHQTGWIALAGFILLVAGIVTGAVWGRTVGATKIENDTVWVSGVCPAFLNELPEK